MHTYRCFQALQRVQHSVRDRISSLSAVNCECNNGTRPSSAPLSTSSWIHRETYYYPRPPVVNSWRRSLSSKAKSAEATSSSNTIQKDDGSTTNTTATTTSSSGTATKRNGRITKHHHKTRPWEDYFSALKDFYKKHGHSNVPYVYKKDPGLVNFIRRQRKHPEDLTDEQTDQLNSLQFDWETHNEKKEQMWQAKFQRLLNYRDEYGTLNVPKNFDIDPALGRWVDKQRYNARRNLLLDHRYQQLDQIGFQWTQLSVHQDTKTHDEKWKRQYQKLVAFYKEHGHTHINRRLDEDPSLGNWVAAQRGLYKKGLLREDRMEKLELIEFAFFVQTESDDENSVWQQHWEEMFEHLKDYQEEHGHANVPPDYEPDGLGTWVASQKRRQGEGRLDPKRKERLLAVGLQFPKSREELWQENYDQLQQFQEKHGHCLVSKRDENVDQVLANWVSSQRAFYRDGRLSEERIAKLEALGFVWNTRSAKTKKTDS